MVAASEIWYFVYSDLFIYIKWTRDNKGCKKDSMMSYFYKCSGDDCCYIATLMGKLQIQKTHFTQIYLPNIMIDAYQSINK